MYAELGVGNITVNWKLTTNSSALGLTLHSNLPKQSFRLSFPESRASDIVTEARAANRPMRSGLVEWSRLNVTEINSLFLKLKDDPGFRRRHRACYDEIRMVQYRTTMEIPTPVLIIEDRLKGIIRSQLEKEIIIGNELRRELEIWDERVEIMRSILDGDKITYLSGVEHGLPKLPPRPIIAIPRSQPRYKPEWEIRGRSRKLIKSEQDEAQDDRVEPTLIRSAGSLAGLDPRSRILMQVSEQNEEDEETDQPDPGEARRSRRPDQGEKRARSLTPFNRPLSGYTEVMENATRDVEEHPTMGRFTGKKKKKTNCPATMTSGDLETTEEDVILRISSPVIFYGADKVAYHLG